MIVNSFGRIELTLSSTFTPLNICSSGFRRSSAVLFPVAVFNPGSINHSKIVTTPFNCNFIAASSSKGELSAESSCPTPSLLARAQISVQKSSAKMSTKTASQLLKTGFIEALISRAVPIPSEEELKSLGSYIVNSPAVLMGEASHGTSDFYRIRQHLSRDLIQRNHPTTKFRFIAVEGDWPPCYAMHRYITAGVGQSARAVLEKEFTRWPTWMWANEEMAEFFEWLKEYNSKLPCHERIGFFGLDVYSLFESIDVVVDELKQVDPKMAEEARKHYSCFERVGGRDEKVYTRSLLFRPEGCRNSVVSVLRKLVGHRMPQYNEEDPDHPDSHIFNAQQNALVVRDAETYYRTMVLGDGESWNVRDYHMTDTLQRLLSAYASVSRKHVAKTGATDQVKQVGCLVWAHNTHIGDHKHSNMAQRGEITIGGVMRERLGEDNVCLLGFSTYCGTVIAARDDWGGEAVKLEVPPAVQGSFDEMMHQVTLRRNAPVWYTIFRDHDTLVSGRLRQSESSSERRDIRREFGALRAGQRAIGVVYDPRIEFLGNYVPCQIVNRYDAMVFVHTSKALRPLNVKAVPTEVPETYPTGL